LGALLNHKTQNIIRKDRPLRFIFSPYAIARDFLALSDGISAQAFVVANGFSVKNGGAFLFNY
jgi:hypothetical protein